MDEPRDEIYEKVINSGIYEEGFKQGFELGLKERYRQGYIKGKFSFALKVKEVHGIDEAVKFSGFSREELENERIDDY